MTTDHIRELARHTVNEIIIAALCDVIDDQEMRIKALEDKANAKKEKGS